MEIGCRQDAGAGSPGPTYHPIIPCSIQGLPGESPKGEGEVQVVDQLAQALRRGASINPRIGSLDGRSRFLLLELVDNDVRHL